MTVDTLSDDIYLAACDLTVWQSLLARMAEAVGAHAACIVYQDTEIQQASGFAGFGFTPEWTARYNDYFGQMDLCFQLMANKPPAVASRILGPETPEVKGNEFYENFFVPQNIYYVAGANVIQDETRHGGLAFHRSLDAGDFSDTDLKTIQKWLPHIQRTFAIYRKFVYHQTSDSIVTSVLSVVSNGIVLFDRFAKVVRHNDQAARFLTKTDVMALTDGQLSLENEDDTVALRQMIMRAVHDKVEISGKLSDSKTIRVDSPPRHVRLVMVPLTNTDPAKQKIEPMIKAAMFIHDPDGEAPLSLDSLSKAFELSTAEARIARDIANGSSVDDIANKNHRSVNTVKSQLKAVFRKTGTSRQSDLVRLLLTGPFHGE